MPKNQKLPNKTGQQDSESEQRHAGQRAEENDPQKQKASQKAEERNKDQKRSADVDEKEED